MTTAIKKLLIKIGVYALLALGAYLFIRDYTRTKNAYSILQANQEILLSEKAGLLAENNRYRVADSLNAIKADITYGFNAVGLIKQLRTMIEAMQTQLNNLGGIVN